jgi:post-segregation antitoxin (ccd killing protein)
LAKASRRLIGFLQQRRPQAVATIDGDATILDSPKRAARWTDDGRTGDQPVVALWAEQDVVLADEFRDGNLPAEHDLLRWLAARGCGYGISADLSRALAAASRTLPDQAWQIEREDGAAIRHGAEVPYLPSAGVAAKDRPAPPRDLVSRVSHKPGRLFADGSAVKHFAVVTHRPDPDGGSGLDRIRWHRGKAGTIGHTHQVLTHELAAEALPSQRFGANAAWFRLNGLRYDLLSAFKRIALPPELHDARPKRRRFVLLNGIGKVVRHARATGLRLVGDDRRRLADAARLALATGPPPIVAA